MSGLRWLLFPLSLLFLLIVKIRQFLFDYGFCKAQKIPVPVISVGNLSAGGTGKTPLVAFLVRQLQEQGKKVGVVSRGYGGRYAQESEKVVASSPQAPQIYGDEPVWFSQILSVPVYVGKKRFSAAQNMIKNEPVDIIVADDGFQHRGLYRDLDIVLIDVTDLETCMLPLGRRREPLSALKRADKVILTKWNEISPQEQQDWLLKIKSYGFEIDKKNLFFMRAQLGNPYALAAPKTPLQWSLFDKVLLVSAIARPLSFERMVLQKTQVLKHFIAADHHDWSDEDLIKIKTICDQYSADKVLVTEKDAVKLQKMNSLSLPIYVVPLEVFLEPCAQDLYAKIY